MKFEISMAFREAIYRSPFRKYVFPWYPYNFTVPQLNFLCRCLDETKNIPGNIAEIGCATGWTTVFLNKFMDSEEVKKEYFAIDTFSGFVAEDVDFEVKNRNKRKNYYSGFRANKKKWFEGTMHQNNITRVHVLEADVNRFDLASLGSMSFVLLDVDLYRPVKKALPELYSTLATGGILVLDDCDPTDLRWDGADQAFKEFIKAGNLPGEIVCGRLGVIRKTV